MTISFCNLCQQNTNHKLIYEFKHNDSALSEEDEDYPPFWSNKHQILQCLGCNVVQYRLESACSEDWPTDPPSINTYPGKLDIKKPDWVYGLPRGISNILEEIYRAYQYNCQALACTGIRTLLDMVFVDKIGDPEGTKPFKTKINEMVESGFLASAIAETVISALVDAGSASAHRGFTPQKSIVKKLIIISTNLLEAIYIHPNEAEHIRLLTPPRNRRRQEP